MSEAAFISAVQKITSAQLDLGGVITAAGEQLQAGQPTLAQQLYRIWLQFNPDHPQAYVAHFNRAGLHMDAGAIAETELLRECLRESFDEFVKVTGAPKSKGSGRRAADR